MRAAADTPSAPTSSLAREPHGPASRVSPSPPPPPPSLLSLPFSEEKGAGRLRGSTTAPLPSRRGPVVGGARGGAGQWRGRGRRGTNPSVGDAVAAVASAAGTGVAVAGVGRWPPARGSAGPVAMEDFIVISDDSGSESSAGTRSGRARRLRRALSRTPGALPRRTVVSERAAARHAPRAPGVATPVPRRRVFPPLAASGLEERGGAAGTAGLGLASAQPHQGCAAERAEHMGDTRSTRADCHAAAAGGLRPGVAPELLAAGRRWGSRPGRSRHRTSRRARGSA